MAGQRSWARVGGAEGGDRAPLAPHATATADELAPLEEWFARHSEIGAVHATFRQERKLRTVKRPLTAPGEFWFRAPGQFRWTVGDPPKFEALQDGGTHLHVVDHRKKQVETFDLSQAEQAGAARRFGFARPAFTRSFAEFSEEFEVKAVVVAGGLMTAELRIRDRQAAKVLAGAALKIWSASGLVAEFVLRFRDRSEMRIVFLTIDRDPEISDAVFQLDVPGYRIRPAALP
jgi:outer membrane lipoprotein-sorting protein